ncbi:MAG TPA: peptidylprolyl isomerase [Pseudomonadales bacterium]|nr:peptidylprolyl isomerase [Pseudomonadales bacterium]
MRFGKSATLVFCAALLLAVGACNPAKNDSVATPAVSVAKEAPAATVNGTPISQRMVDLIAKRGVGAGRPDTPEARSTIIDQLTLQVVLSEEALKKGLDKSPEVAEQMAALKQSVLANAYVEDFIKNNPVSDEAVKAAYDRIKGTITGNEYQARHILVDKESEAKEIIAKLKKDPGAFAKLAIERSKDEGSKDRGGDLGWFDLKRMDPAFGAAVSKLEKGTFTEEPVKTQFGYHVILLEDVKPIEAPPIEDVKTQLTQQIQQQNVKKQIETLKAAAKIEIAGAPAPAATPSTPSTPASTN